MTTPAGWYADPNQPGQQRYWDGAAWTAHIAPAAAPPPAPGYGAPGWAPPYVAQPPKTNGMAVASLVLGILWLYWLGSILALVFGYVARSQITSSGGAQGGGGLAIAGIVLGWVGVGTLLLIILLGGLGAFAAP